MQVRIGFDALDARILPDMGVKVAFLSDPTAGGNGGPEGAPRRTIQVPRAAIRGSSAAIRSAEPKPEALPVRPPSSSSARPGS